MSDFPFDRHKVLLCDPCQEIKKVVETTYNDVGVGEFVHCDQLDKTIECLPDQKPDLILVGMDFGEMNGIQVIQKIRSLNDGLFYKTPILMILDKASPNLLREACRVGIEGALKKPLSPEKILRFSRAVISKPRRFICVRHYFGPERRSKQNASFDGEDRRLTLNDDELTTDYFTKSRSSAEETVIPGQSQLGGGSLGGSSSAKSGSPDWYEPKSSSKEKADGDVMNLGGETKTKKALETIDIAETKTKKSADSDIEVSKAKPETKPKAEEVKPQAEKAKKAPEEKAKKPEKAEAEKEIPKPDKPEKKDEPPKEKIVKAGPDTDEFEEIQDLDECLEEHKLWINSGGKLGKQANRPRSDFRSQPLEELDFTQSVLPQSNFEDVNCTRTVFRKSDLSGSTFRNAMLSSADLRVTLLRKADLRNARMENANLLGADLSGANLEGASMRGVNLSGANLTKANLRGVNMVSVTGLNPEQIKRAIIDPSTRLPIKT